MNRRQLREHVFKLLFRVEFNQLDEMPEQIRIYMDDMYDENQLQLNYIHKKVDAIIEKIPELDQIINEKAEGWSTARMGKVDLTIIRLAVYEMKMDDDIPVSVAINEAVELAKCFGQDESPSFINGVLAKIA
ncbi:MAG: transcription antitermination factor NusB [Clostridia bacterium]|nr:transcription antitermination factor NusB [Clostridia bacterium]